MECDNNVQAFSRPTMLYRSTPALFLIASLSLRAAMISAPPQTASPGQAVIASLGFSSEGQAIAGIQFDLDWDQALDVKLVVGDQLRQSPKLLYTSVQGPRT